MKTITAIFCLVAFSSIASAQSPDPSKWMCRNLTDSGGFTYQGETIFGTQACRPIPQTAVAPAPPKQDTTSSVAIAAPTTVAYIKPSSSSPNSTETSPAASPVAGPAPSTTTSTASPAQLGSGAVVAIAPMGGFDTYLA